MAARQPKKTLVDFMVIALSPVLIMALVGSLCFFLIGIFYRGEAVGAVRWVMFWFVVGSVMVSRIAIEESPEYAALYGLALGAAVWIYLVRTHPSYLIGLVLLAVVWFCAHKLVWDCTLIDDDQDASGEGLLQKARPPSRAAKPKRPPAASDSPGRWVVWFSLAALPLFGLGQVLLPADDSGGRRAGLAFLVVYMAAALGLLVTTSFLGLRRYLRQRYLRMPGVIALAWVKLGGGVALLILAAALFLPRPGAGAAWSALRGKVDYRLRQASQHASSRNPHGEGEGRAGHETADSKNDPGKGTDPGAKEQPTQEQEDGRPQAAASGQPAPSPEGNPADIHAWLRAAVWLGAGLLAIWWLVRCRRLLVELFRVGWRAVLDFIRRCLDLVPARKPVRLAGAAVVPTARRPLSAFKNPFFAAKEHARPPVEIILYTYDALQAWAGEQGIELRPEQTAREFCQAMGGPLPELAAPLRQLSFLYAHAAYGERLPADCDLEPLKELWRRLTWNQVNAP